MTEKIKILPKRIGTKEEGIFYKEVQKTTIDNKGNIEEKIVDKVFIIRYREKNKERFITMGKYSQGIRINYCKQKRNEYMTIAKNGELPPQIQQRDKQEVLTLENLANVYFKGKEGENKSNAKQQAKYNLHIRPYFLDMDVHKIIKEDIRIFRKGLMDKKKAPKTINGIIQLLTAIFNYSIKEHDLKLISPTTGIKRLKVDDNRERFLNIDEVNNLIEKVKCDDILYTFVKTALYTGARLEALVNIQKKDIDLIHKTIKIKDFKSDTTYTGFFSDSLKDEITKPILTMAANHYLIGGSFEPFPSRTIQNRLKPILDKLFNEGLDRKDRKNRVVIHTLRHTFASQLAINGIPIFTIQKLMNHTNIEMTLRYAKLAPDSGKDAVINLYS